MLKTPKLLFLLLAALLATEPLSAIKPRSKYFASKEEADNYLLMRYNKGCCFYNEQNWRKAAPEFEKVIFYFPATEAAAEASYYLAVSYYSMKEFDFANEEFSNYLKASEHPLYFEDALQYKFCIAEHFKNGKKKRPFKMRYLPKWISAQDSALEIYDDIIAALPNSPLTIAALTSKARLLVEMEEYRNAIETYQILIRRFPKNEIVPCCYVEIAEAYVKQAKVEVQNPDILGLAELNARKFKDDFPRDERVALAEAAVQEIKEAFARGLTNIALFYERKKHPKAAAIYFQSAIEEYPDTAVAQFCKYKLVHLNYGKEEVSVEEEEEELEEEEMDEGDPCD